MDNSSYSDSEINAPVVGELFIHHDGCVYEIVSAHPIPCGGENCPGSSCPGCWDVHVMELSWIVA